MEGQKKLVWLDCDPGADDAMAIFLAAYSDKLTLLGISTVHGNSSLEKVTNNALKVLKMGGIEGIPVYRGAEESFVRKHQISTSFHGESGIDGCVLPDTDQQPITDDVFHSIYLKIKQQPSKVYFIATGAQTNIAILLTSYPDIKNYIQEISVMGGAVQKGNYSPAAEFNIACDPEAAEIVLNSGLPVIMAPIDLTMKIAITAEVIAQIDSLQTEFSQNVKGFLNFYLARYKQRYNWDYAILHDPCSVFYVINPSAFSVSHRNVVIETKGEYCVGRTVVDEYNVTGRKPNCYIAIDINTQLFWNDMLFALNQANHNSPMK